jgi:ATP-dependent DNA helicase RecQ
VADHVATVGKLARSSLVLRGGTPDVRQLSSADEAALWRDRLDLSEAGQAVPGRAVLLVVDATSSLWPVTVAAALLGQAGASVVLPLVLHRRP